MKSIRVVINPHEFTSIEIARYRRAWGYPENTLVYLCDSQDLRALREHFGNAAMLANITGAFVIVDNGDYAQVWITESPRPYDTRAPYCRVGFNHNQPTYLQKVRVNKSGYDVEGNYWGVLSSELGDLYRYSSYDGDHWRYIRAQDRESAKIQIRTFDTFADFWR